MKRSVPYLQILDPWDNDPDPIPSDAAVRNLVDSAISIGGYRTLCVLTYADGSAIRIDGPLAALANSIAREDSQPPK